MTQWFRRKAFGRDFANVVPKWHAEESVEGTRVTAACEYSYRFDYERPLRVDTRPPLGECCSKCVAAVAVAQPFETGNSGTGQAVVRFPSLEEQAKGMFVVPRHKRMQSAEDSKEPAHA